MVMVVVVTSQHGGGKDREERGDAILCYLLGNNVLTPLKLQHIKTYMP